MENKLAVLIVVVSLATVTSSFAHQAGGHYGAGHGMMYNNMHHRGMDQWMDAMHQDMDDIGKRTSDSQTHEKLEKMRAQLDKLQKEMEQMRRDLQKMRQKQD